MAPIVEKLTEPVTLGEGPHWDVERQCLFFVSILDNTIHKYVPATKKHTSAKLDGRVGFITPVEGSADQFVVGMDQQVVVVRWSGQEGAPAQQVKVMSRLDEHAPGTCINDAKADPRGRLYAGTMSDRLGANIPPNKGSLYKLEADGSHKILFDRVNIANGLTWDVERKAFYYIDSLEYAVRRYDYDIDTGDIANCKLIFQLKDHNIPGMLDGMTIDTDGNLWVAIFQGSQVLQIDPTGKLLRRVTIPAAQVTSVAFGGVNLDELYVTTGCFNLGNPTELEPPCGATFKVTGLGVRGLPMMPVKLA